MSRKRMFKIVISCVLICSFLFWFWSFARRYIRWTVCRNKRRLFSHWDRYFRRQGPWGAVGLYRYFSGWQRMNGVCPSGTECRFDARRSKKSFWPDHICRSEYGRAWPRVWASGRNRADILRFVQSSKWSRMGLDTHMKKSTAPFFIMEISERSKSH